MRFLVDANLSQRVAARLRSAGHADRLTPDQQANLILANLDAVAHDLASGAVVTIGRGHLRMRSLPMRRGD